MIYFSTQNFPPAETWNSYRCTSDMRTFMWTLFSGESFAKHLYFVDLVWANFIRIDWRWDKSCRVGFRHCW